MFSTLAAYGWSAIAYVAPFLFVLALVVFVHEFGHFLIGRLCGVKVEVFSLGMGPEVIGRTDRLGTRWRVSAIPLGGFVRFAGDRGPETGNLSGEPANGAAIDPRVTLGGQRLPQRAAIVVAGPVANILFAIAVFAVTVYFVGENKLAPRISSVDADSAAAEAGFKPGDLIRAVNGEVIDSFAGLYDIVGQMGGETISVEVERDGKTVSLSATPKLVWADTPFGRQHRGVLGLHASNDPKDISSYSPGPAESLKIGVQRTWELMVKTCQFVGRLLTGHARTDQLSGPIGISQVTNTIAPMGFLALMNLAGLLSVSLGLFNLAPIPIFDGGHLMFYAIEGLRGRPLSRRAQDFGVKIGFVFLIALTLFVTFNDIRRIVAL